MKVNGLRRRAVMLGTLIAALLTLATTASEAAGRLVISQVYPGGGGSGATAAYKTDFVEIFNAGDAAISLNGLSLQYASSAGTFNAAAPLPDVMLQPGQYFLVKLGTVGTGGADLTGEDATGGLNLSGSSGKVALVNGTTALGSGVDCAGAKAASLDLVGWGAANCFEGSAAVPNSALTVSTALIRTSGGCQDTNDNAADFSVATPTPRNTSSPLSPCTGPQGPTVSDITFDPANPNPGQSTTISATVTPGTSQTITSVTADASTVGAGTVTLTKGAGTTWTGTINVAAATAPGSYSISVTATDAGGLTGNALTTLSVNDPNPSITVAQARAIGPTTESVKVRGVVTASTTGNIYIQDATQGGAGIQVFDGSPGSGVVGILQADGSTVPVAVGDVLEVTGTMEEFQGELELNAAANDPQSIQIVSRGGAAPAPLVVPVTQTGDEAVEGTLGRVNNVTAVSVPTQITGTSNAPYLFQVQDANANLLTVYVYRNATTRATTPIPGVPANAFTVTAEGTLQINAGGTERAIEVGDQFNLTGILAEDLRNTPTNLIRLRNSLDAEFLGKNLVTGITVAPKFAAPGQSVTMTVTTDPSAGTTVRGDLSSVGGSATTTFSGPDFEGNFTTTFTVPTGLAPGLYTIPVTATNGSVTGYGSGQVYVAQVVSTIAAARALPVDTPVRVQGTVTSFSSGAQGHLYIQDATGGMAVVTFGVLPPLIFEGDLVEVTGLRDDYSGSLQIDYTQGEVKYLSAGTTPAPVVIPQAQWPANLGKLVRTNNLVVTGPVRVAGQNDIYPVSDGTFSGEIFLGPVSKPLVTAGKLAEGSAVDVIGPVDVFQTSTSTVYQIKPRGDADVIVSTGPAVVPAKLAFTAQPTSATAGAAISPAPVVTVQNADGATVTTYSGPVTLFMSGGASGAKLSGAATVNAVNGVATFNNLSIDLPGTNYVLTAKSGTLTTAATAPFAVTSGALKGDIDKSGTVNSADAAMALRVAGGLLAATDATVSVANGDVVPNGTITLADAVAIARAATGTSPF